MSKLKAVVVRHLCGENVSHRPVVCFVIEQLDDSSVDFQTSYMTEKAVEKIEKFLKTAVEFKQAKWYLDIIEDYTDELVYSVELDFSS